MPTPASYISCSGLLPMPMLSDCPVQDLSPGRCPGAGTPRREIRSPLPGLPEEVVLLIIDELPARSIPALARVSWNFWRVAVPKIWEDLGVMEGNPHINQLLGNPYVDPFAVESSDACHVEIEEEAGSLPGGQSQATLERSTLAIHSPLVKRLALRLCNEDDLYYANLITILADLDAQGATRILPNLKQLEVVVVDITDSEDDIARALRPLMTPTIKTVNIHFDTDSMDELEAYNNARALCSVLRLLHRLQLDRLSITSQDHEIVAMDASFVEATIRSVVAHQRTLTHLTISDFASRFTTPFYEASRLPLLKDVRLAMTRLYDLDSTPIARIHATHSFIGGEYDESPSFSSLRHVTANVSARDVGLLLSSVTSTDLSTLELHLQCPGTTVAGSLAPVGYFSKLQTIVVTYPKMRGNWDDLTPVLSCHDARNIWLRGDRISEVLGDAEISLAAQAWPLLVSLFIADSYLERTRGGPEVDRARYSPSATLAGLTAFALHCPSLIILTIPVDARGTPKTPPAEAVGFAVRGLQFSDSPVDEEGPVARFIARTWPNITRPGPSRHNATWNRIWDLVEVARAEEEAGRSGETHNGTQHTILPLGLRRLGLVLLAFWAWSLYFQTV